MFRETDRQLPLLPAAAWLPESVQRRLDASWAGVFRRQVYPLLLESEGDFAALYDEGNGRPNWSVARILALCLLQDVFDLSDQAALDQLVFDVRWQYALDLEPDKAYLSRRSLVGFRTRLVQHDPEMHLLRGVFDYIGRAALDDLGVSTGSQRLDSTFISSNIHVRGQLDLFQKTLDHFLKWLEAWAPDEFRTVAEPVREWFHAAPEGFFAMPKGDDLNKRIHEVATWCVEVVLLFEDDEAVAEAEPFKLLQRLVSERCEVTVDDSDSGDDGDGGGEDVVAAVTVREQPVNKGEALRSPHDPDARYGFKGLGYSVQVAETCENEGTEILTDFDVHPANEVDAGRSTEVLDRLIEQDTKPERLYADAGYASLTAFGEAEARDVDLRARIANKSKVHGAFGRDAFTYDGEGYVVSCPRGHAPVRHSVRTAGRPANRGLHAFFDKAVCDACPLHEQCPVRSAPGSRVTNLNVGLDARTYDAAVTAQRDPEWWVAYRIRCGIEATNSELKRAHGLGRLRVRGMARVRLAVTSKLTACNIKRWMRACARRAPLSGPQDRPGGRRNGPSRTLATIAALARQVLRGIMSGLSASHTTSLTARTA